MPFPIEQKLVLAVSSSAVFDMTEAQRVYDEEGIEAYRTYQRTRLAEPFQKGVAFPFIRRLLRLNQHFPEQQPVEVVVLSKNDSDTGRRFFRSCQHYKLDITRGAFLTGRSPHSYLASFNASLFLSASEADVKAAIQVGLPAGLVLPCATQEDESDQELRVAFDFDGVLADDEAERVYQAKHDLAEFNALETRQAAVPHNPGPLQRLITNLSALQKLAQTQPGLTPAGTPLIRVAVITARGAPSNERFVTTLNAWNIKVDETFFMGGIEKARVLEILKPHLFFDDQLKHLAAAAHLVPSVHIPFGVANQPC